MDLKDDTYETLFLVHSKEQNMLVLNVKGHGEVLMESNLPYSKGPSRQFVNKKESALDDIHNSCNNINDKMSLAKKKACLNTFIEQTIDDNDDTK